MLSNAPDKSILQRPKDKMPAPLEQINVSYQPGEDRLLMKVTSNREEYRIWLTRRYTALLLGVLENQLNALGTPTATRTGNLASKLKQGAYEKPFKAENTRKYPLGEQGILGYRINVSKPKDGSVNLQLLPEQGQGLNLKLDEATTTMFCNLIEQGLTQTDWQLGASAVSPDLMH
jgi:hypothetical protein